MRMFMTVRSAQRPVSTTIYNVIVVGAGPYGLSIAAHLLMRRLNVAVFGKPLQLWRNNMPEGMLLRSYWWATNLSDPYRKYGLAQYFQLHGQDAPDPLPIETFIDYGLWFQKQAVPDIDETYVACIERVDGTFKVTLEDERVVFSRSIVMAPGLRYYAYRPSEYDHLSPELVSHSSDYNTFDRFAGKKVIVVGGGQGGLESAALLHESGADVEVIACSPIHWLRPLESLEKRALIEKIRIPKAGIAPGWINWGLEKLPYAFHRLSRSTKDELIDKRNGPAGAAWLKPRLVKLVPLHEGVRVVEMRETDDGIAVHLSNGEVVKADHIILATGYRVDISRLPMLAPSLIAEIQTYQKAPVLNSRFESNVPGLYFAGMSSVSSFGPLYRFVVGTEAAARRIAGSVAKQVKYAKITN